MNQIFTIIATILFAILGGGATLYLLISIPAVFIYKVYRCIRYKKSLYD